MEGDDDPLDDHERKVYTLGRTARLQELNRASKNFNLPLDSNREKPRKVGGVKAEEVKKLKSILDRINTESIFGELNRHMQNESPANEKQANKQKEPLSRKELGQIENIMDSNAGPHKLSDKISLKYPVAP